MNFIKESSFDFIEKIVYINLSKRVDRRDHIEKMTSIFGNKVIRFEAIVDKPGCIGCSKSHIEVLKMAIQNNWKNVLVLEDDVDWNDNIYSIPRLEKITSSDYDVVLLGGMRVKICNETFKLKQASAASSYLVNRHYFTKLLYNFEEGLFNLIESPIHGKYKCPGRSAFHLDVYWMKLMEEDLWYIIIPNLIYQIDGYSDLSCSFRLQKRVFII